MIDQFRRAAISVSLNIAEGSGKITELQKHHCYDIARCEAMVCAAIVGILQCMRMIDVETAKSAKDLLENVSGHSQLCLYKNFWWLITEFGLWTTDF